MIDVGRGLFVLMATWSTFCFWALQNAHAELIRQSNNKNTSADEPGEHWSKPAVMHKGSEDSQRDEIDNYKGHSAEKRPWQQTSADYETKRVKQKQGLQSNSTYFGRIAQQGGTSLSEDEKHDATCILTFWTYVFVRKRVESEPLVVVIVNTGLGSETVCVKKCAEYSLPDYLLVIGSSDNSGFRPGYKFYLSESSGPPCSLLPPRSSVTLSTEMRPANQGNCHLLYIPLLLISVVCVRLIFPLNHH